MKNLKIIIILSLLTLALLAFAQTDEWLMPWYVNSNNYVWLPIGIYNWKMPALMAYEIMFIIIVASYLVISIIAITEIKKS
ncbi:MAG: hypothetical protein QW478_15165 [Candidatus Micrarchaeaceae archaeon]